MNIKITGSGSYIPTEIISNNDFSQHVFLNDDGSPFPLANDVITQKFYGITGIEERRYVTDDLLTSDIAVIAAKKAIEDAKIDPETLDYIIFAHNFGNVKKGAIQADLLPSLATRVKHDLRIKNPKCVAYDMLFGCPGWIESRYGRKMFSHWSRNIIPSCRSARQRFDDLFRRRRRYNH
jgi:3-oxoacyl-[acyl-carrier-protein] synthase III